MSRYHYNRDLGSLLKAAQEWRNTCFIGDDSLLGNQPIWKLSKLEELEEAFVQNPLEGNESYQEKLRRQLAGVSAQASQLMAEMHWILLLFPHNINPSTKRDLIKEIWDQGGKPLNLDHPLLQDDVLSGAAHSGTAFNTHRWRELIFLIHIITAFKELPVAQREQTLSDPWIFSDWLASVPREGYRQFRHMLRWLLFPDHFERICTASDKQAILAQFQKTPMAQIKQLSDQEVDQGLLSVRESLESDSDEPVDFYTSPWLEQWRPSPNAWLLLWNPRHWDWNTFQDDRLRVARGESVTIPWRTISKQLKEGDTAYLMRLGEEPKGLMARGTVTSEPYEDTHYSPEKAKLGEKALFVDITLTDLRDPKAEAYISQADLASGTTDGQNWTPQGSGIEIKPRSAKLVNMLWNRLPAVQLVEAEKPTPRQQAISIGRPVNQIFYGPPGTGKTHHWRSHLQPKYERAASQVSTGEWFEEQLANNSWWETVALALADLTQHGNSATVNELLLHPYFKAKTRVQGRVGSSNLRAQCWAALQSHTVMESEAVNYSPDKRQPPLIFDKKSGGQWILTGDWEETGEGLRDQLKKLQQGPQSAESRIKRHLTVTFHQSYSYEDFVEGIRPQTTEGGITYEVRDGLFKMICNRARQDPEQRYALFIDEINRGNITRIFGELITLIESDKRAWWDDEGSLVDGMEVTLPYSGDLFGVPKNLDIYATMNTADRSIALMDAALRRRFRFIELMPQPQQITGNQGDGYIPDGEGDLLSLRDLLNAINLRLRYLLHRDQTFGHAYFMDVKDIDSLRKVIVYDIIPMLAEYFYDDWEQIRRVLADDTIDAVEHQIISREVLDPGQLFTQLDVDLPEKSDFMVKEPRDITPDALRKIYDSPDTPK